MKEISNSNSDTLQIKKLTYDKHVLIKHDVLMKKTSDKQTPLRGLATVNFYAADVKAAKKWYSELLPPLLQCNSK
jgi:hypothetical protein